MKTANGSVKVTVKFSTLTVGFKTAFDMSILINRKLTTGFA